MLLNEVLQLKEKSWSPKDLNPVVATLTTLGESKKGQYYWEQQIQITDEQGVTANATYQSKYENGLIPQTVKLPLKARWCLKWYAAKGKKHLVGYCLDKIEAQSTQHQEQCQQLQDAIDSRAGETRPRDYDAENRGKCRTQFIKAAIASGQIVLNSENIVGDIISWTEFAMTGIVPQQQTGVLNEDVPWENS